MDHLPIFRRLCQRDCLLVGGRDVAERKARLLPNAGANVAVSALDFTPQFQVWADSQILTLVQGEFIPSLLDTCWLAIAATDNETVNQQVGDAAGAWRIFCSVMDTPRQASFIISSIIDRSPLIVAVSSDETSPVLARLLREKLESVLPLHLDQLARCTGHLRAHIKQQFVSMGERRCFWEKPFMDDRLAQSLANDDQQAMVDTTEQLLTEPLKHRSEVILVGAGPGDAGLLILKGLQQIQQTDVVVYGQLAFDDIMSLVRRDVDRMFVGKRSGYHCVPQEGTNQILLRGAQKGKRVVQLKGDNPFIFDRGREELEAPCETGIPFPVVPGVTAASGCSTCSGIPLTHRDFAQGIRLVTGHLRTGGELDWANLAVEKQILVFYMGLSQAPAIREKLLTHGMAEDMPTAIVRNGTAVSQKAVSGTLGQLDILTQQMASPALIIVGRVVGLRDKLNWFSSR